MRVLIAEDDEVAARVLSMRLKQWGYEGIWVSNGLQARDLLCEEEGPQLALLDWMMPGLDGPEVCRLVRQVRKTNPPYLILITARGSREDVVTGIEAGADDYIVKPFHAGELKVRIGAGSRIIELQTALQSRIQQAEEALQRVRQLQGLLPICSYCKSIRDDKAYWHQVESYITQHSEALFSHSICPDCFKRHIQPELDSIAAQKSGPKQHTG